MAPRAVARAIRGPIGANAISAREPRYRILVN
jgi:hypothetical protein